MSDTNLDPLVLDLVEWIGTGARPYAEVMDAWRTSCPRLTVWEEAVERGYIERSYVPGQGAMVTVTDRGSASISARRRGAASRIN